MRMRTRASDLANRPFPLNHSLEEAFPQLKDLELLGEKWRDSTGGVFQLDWTWRDTRQTPCQQRKVQIDFNNRHPLRRYFRRLRGRAVALFASVLVDVTDSQNFPVSVSPANLPRRHDVY